MKAKRPNKAYQQMKGCLVLIALGLIGIMYVQWGQGTTPPAQESAAVTATGAPIEMALMAIQDPPVRSVLVNADIKRVLVVFTTTTVVAEIDTQLTTLTCAARALMPEGYDLRLGSKLTNDITVVTAQVSAKMLAAMSCSQPINWTTFADEYSLASGLQARALPQQQQSPTQAQARFVCPENCDAARAGGLTARQAADCGLDRDGDGVACYGD